ncbi:O-antigen polysaccharide polymerase Wzy family protein [Planococcus rifietoensis]|uniref:O-antigen polysaccharide polymerase Wzy family protein n=1 Tax=Planococcus rifietoensis TaxID=200991 RepID=UPI00384F48AD
MNLYFRTFFMLLSIVLIISALNFEQLNIAYIAVLFIFIHNLIYATYNLEAKIIFLLFHFTFFTFLISRIILTLSQGMVYEPFSNNTTNLHIGLSLYLSLLGVYIGFEIITYFKKNIKKKVNTDNKNTKFNRDYTYKIRKISLVLMWIAFCAVLLREIETLIIMRETSYTELRIAYNSSLPSILIRIANMYFLFFCIYLATLPSKREVFFPFIGFLALGVIVLLYGVRGDFVLNILFTVFYFYLRNHLYSNNQKWFGKRETIILIVSIPIILFSMNYIGEIRYSNDYEVSTDENEIIESFFYNQGVSVDIIGYVREYEESFPENGVYSFDRTLHFLKNNAFSKAIFNTEEFRAHTLERAIYGNSLGQTLSYLVYPESYFRGVGMGSSYIAELYKDFGYSGLIILNIFYGVMMAIIVPHKTRNIWIITCSLLLIQGLFYAPRSSFDGFVSNIISFPNLAGILIVIVLSKININYRRDH